MAANAFEYQRTNRVMVADGQCDNRHIGRAYLGVIRMNANRGKRSAGSSSPSRSRRTGGKAQGGKRAISGAASVIAISRYARSSPLSIARQGRSDPLVRRCARQGVRGVGIVLAPATRSGQPRGDPWAPVGTFPGPGEGRTAAQWDATEPVTARPMNGKCRTRPAPRLQENSTITRHQRGEDVPQRRDPRRDR